MLESRAFTSWLSPFNRAITTQYAFTIFFGIMIAIIVTIGAVVLNSKVTEGANRQLIHTLEHEIGEDLSRDLDRYRLSGQPITIDIAKSGRRLDVWFTEISRDIGASAAQGLSGRLED